MNGRASSRRQMLIVFPLADSPASPIALPKRLVSSLRVRDFSASSYTRYASVALLVRHPAIDSVKSFRKSTSAANTASSSRKPSPPFARQRTSPITVLSKMLCRSPARHIQSCLSDLRRTKQSHIGVPGTSLLPRRRSHRLRCHCGAVFSPT